MAASTFTAVSLEPPLGVAPPPVLQQHLTPDALAAAITQAVTDPHVRHNAARLGERLTTEHGTAAAATQLETLTGDRTGR